MAASLWRMSKWRTLRGCLRAAHWHISGVGDQTGVNVRTLVTTQISRAKSSDVHRQQQAAEVTAESQADSSTHSQVSVEEALQHEDYFKVKELVTVRDLFDARVHFGHNAGLRHESMEPYVFGTRQGVDIIDLEQTFPLLHHAMNVCAHTVYRGGMVLVLSRKLQVSPWVERMAKEVGEYSHCRPWKRGIFTNASDIFGTLPIYPDLCIFFNTQDSVFETHRAVVESSKLLVPTIGIVDTNCDCSDITYPIPANDDSPVSQHLFIDLFRTVILRAKQKRKEDGVETATPTTESS